MSDLSLQSYLRKVESLLDGGRLEEAKAQARHILSHFPKNGAAYLLLGRVLVAQRLWEDAAEVLRRLLGADPLNVTAHQLLSQSYLELFQLDNAIYHLERAFDQTPNDPQIIAGLRALYSRSRNEPVEKIQLTAGAVAGQYLSNNLPDPAIDILRKAIRRFPDRVDLKLVLAQAYQTAEMSVEAAETAVDVLKRLPFAVMANQLVAQFWMSQQRPSDARLNIVRIEEVDPYLALKLVTGKVDEHRYTLPELDYGRLAEREMSTENPDWLTALTQSDMATTPVASEIPESFQDDDDLSWLMTEEPAPVAPAPRRKVTDDLSDLLADIPATATGAENVPTPIERDESFSGGLRPEVMRRLDALKGAANDGTLITSARPAEEPVMPEIDSMLDDINLESSDWLMAAGIELVDVDAQSMPLPSIGLTGLLTQMGEGDEAVLPAASSADSLDFMSDISTSSPVSPQSGRVSTGFTDKIRKQQTEDEAARVQAETEAADFFASLDYNDSPPDYSNFDEPSTDELPRSSANFFDELEFEDGIQSSDISHVGQLDDSLVDDRDFSFNYSPTAKADFFDDLEYSDEIVPVSSARVGQLDSDILPDTDEISRAEANPLAWMGEINVEYDPQALDPFQVAAAYDYNDRVSLQEIEEDPLAWMSQTEVEMEADPDEDALAWMQSMTVDEEALGPDEAVYLYDPADADRPDTDESAALTDPETRGEWQNTMSDEPNWQDDEDVEGFEWLGDDNSLERAADLTDESIEALDWMRGEDARDPDLSGWRDQDQSDLQTEASTGFTGMLDNLGNPQNEEDGLGWMNQYRTDYLSEQDLNAVLDEADNEMDFDVSDDAISSLGADAEMQADQFASNFDLSDDNAGFLLDDPELLDPAFEFEFQDDPAAPGWLNSIESQELPALDLDQSPSSDAPDFGFDDDELNDFGMPLAGDFADADEPLVMNDFSPHPESLPTAADFGFGEDELNDFGMPLVSDFADADEALAMNDFSADLDQPLPTAGDFGFGEDELNDFGMLDEPLTFSETDLDSAEAVVNDFDFTDLQTDTEPEFGFDSAELDSFGMDEPIIANEFDFGADQADQPIADDFVYDLEDPLSTDFSLFDEDDPNTEADFDFTLDEEPVVVNEFGFELDEELAVVNDFDLASLQAPDETDFGFDTTRMESFGSDEPDFAFDEDPLTVSEYDFALEDEEHSDWLSQIDGQDSQELDTQQEPDWLSQVGVTEDESPVVAEDEPAWMAAVDVPHDTMDRVDEIDWEASPEIVDATLDDVYEDDYAAELFAEPVANREDVNNAPDWLNSMVPGLDVDYENLPTSDLVEDEFSDAQPHRGRRLDGFSAVNDGYEWLDDMVEEETNNMPAVSEPVAVAPLAPLPEFSRTNAPAPLPISTPAPTRRFIFDTPPAWLTALRNRFAPNVEPSEDMDEFADFEFDDDELS